MNCQAVWFFLLTMFNCTAIGIHMIYYSIFSFTPSYILMILALCYWGYMFFLEMSYSGESTAGEGLINDRNTNFMADTLFRYLFVIIIGNALFSYIFRIYYRVYIPRYANPEVVFKYMMLSYIYWYSYSILPFACIVDFCCRKRNRTPNPKYDLTITLLFAIIIGLMDDNSGINLNYRYGQLNRVIANIISMGITYLIYDYLLFKINGGQWYTLYPQGTSTAY